MISVLFLSTFVLNAQSPFSGKWILDHSKSDAEFRDYEITLVITQTLKSFTAEQTLTMKNGENSIFFPKRSVADIPIKERRGSLA